MIYNENNNSNILPLTFSNFDSTQQNITIKKFLIKLERPTLTFSLNFNFQISKLFDNDLGIQNFENFIPAPFEYSRFLFVFSINVNKSNFSPRQINLYSDFIHTKDYIIEIECIFNLIDMNTASFEFQEFKVYKISENLQTLEVFQQLLAQDKNLLKEYNMGTRRLDLKPPEDDINQIFTPHDVEIIANNKYVNQISFRVGRNSFNNPIIININLAKILYIYARNCNVTTTTFNKLYSNETNLIGFLFIDDIEKSDVFYIKPEELAPFKVDYNSYLEILDENNDYVNINKIVLFYKLN